MKVSCIILNCLNDLFVKNRLIPSIIKNSKMSSTEIIVVDNSPTQDFKYKKNVKVIRSEPFHIPKGYNKGVKESKGKYVALFHDDCELLDKNWIKKLTTQLSDKVYAVGPEIHELNFIKFLKEVPMMVEKKRFLKIGGYDETYYFGYEDIIFSQAIIDKGKRIKKVKIKYNHYNGMSSYLLMYGEKNRNILKRKFTTPKNFINNKLLNSLNTKFNNSFIKYIGGPTNRMIPINSMRKKLPKTKNEVNNFIKTIQQKNI